MLNEPAVTITNLLLVLECAVFATFLARRHAAAAWVVLFVGSALASLFGGVVHGFFPDPESGGNYLFWAASMLSIGATSGAMVYTGVAIGWGSGRARRLLPALAAATVGYGVVVIFINRDFMVAIAAYLPAALFLLFVFARRALHGRPAGAPQAIAGVVVALAAAAAQNARVGIHPQLFNHNAVYHVVQGLALYLLFRAALAVEKPS